MHHPDDNRQTVRMPFAQLRALVLSLIDPATPLGQVAEGSIDLDRFALDAFDLDALDLDAIALDDEADDAAREFEAQRTTHAINRPRVSTLDQLIAALPRR